MSREVTQDFEELKKFLEEYKLEKVFQNEEITEELKKTHKKYFSLLTLISELEPVVDDISFNPKLTKSQFSYLVESSSDIGTAIFQSVNGSYKSARMLLRSSIETFFKGFCMEDIDGILTEKRIFVIFDAIKELDYFKQDTQKALLHTCLDEYSELCKDIHTASVANMQNLTALKYFPSYEKSKMYDISERIIKLIPIFLFFTCNKFNPQYQNMHHRNKENILLSIRKKLRPIILSNFDKLK